MHLEGPHGGSDRSEEAQYDIEFFARKHGLPPELACHIIDYAGPGPMPKLSGLSLARVSDGIEERRHAH